MSKTGTYKMVDGKCVKVSDDVPRIASRIDGVYYPGSPYKEYFNGREPTWITSKGDKKAEMSRRGIVEMADDDIKHEKAGKIYSYNGQKRKGRNLKPTPKTPKRLQHLTANM